MEFDLDTTSQAEICAKTFGQSAGCPKHLSLKGFRALLKNLPKEAPETKTVEAAVAYVGIVLVLYLALLALFVRGSLGRFVGSGRTSTGRRHVVTLSPKGGPSYPTLADHYPTPAETAAKV